MLKWWGGGNTADARDKRASPRFEVNCDARGKLITIMTVDFQSARQADRALAIAAQNAILQRARQTRMRSRTIRVVLHECE